MARPIPAPPAAEPTRAERVLATMSVTVVGLSVLAILAVVLAPALGVREYGGIWAVVVVLPLIGLPIAVGLAIALFTVHAIRRSRAAAPRR